MQLFFLTLSLIINPYILLLISSSVSNIKFPKIYSLIIVISFFVFTNLRNFSEGFLYADIGDDADDYIIGSVAIMSKYSILDILSGKADAFLNHIDKIFALYQLLLVKIFPANSIPIVLSITFGTLILLTLFTYPFISKGLIKLKPNILISLLILNPYIIYLNQSFFRQAIALGVLLTFSLPYGLYLFMKENGLKNKKFEYIFLILSIVLAAGLHRGSIIPIIIFISISIILSTGIISQIYLFFTKLVIVKRFLLTIGLLASSFYAIYVSSKYLNIFLIYTIYDLTARESLMGFRTIVLSFFISLYVIYTSLRYPLIETYQPILKKVIFNFAICNLLISIISIFFHVGLERVLFSNNILSLFSITLTHEFNRKLFNLFTFSIGVLTYLFYVFLKEGFWGKGNYLLPYFY